MKLETLAIHAGRVADPATGAISPPIHLSTTFERGVDGSYPRGYSYSRTDNPGRKVLERSIAALESGADATAWASGSAASLAIFSLLRRGDRVVAPEVCYHGTGKQLRDIVSAWGVEVEFVDMTSVEHARRALEPGATLLWVETPSNPLLGVSDIASLCELARQRRTLVCCDNTFATPLLQRPLGLGADLVMHSSTKYLGGHSDVTGGVVVAREAGELAARLRDYQSTAGSIPSPFDCWLLSRSLATLSCRVRTQSASAARIAEFLIAHDGVERVFYPGLPSHPGHAIALQQMHGGYGAMLSFCVPGGDAEALAVVGRTQLFTRATSLGGVESLIEHRASIEGPHTRTPRNLIRVSVGLEHVDDLIDDLGSALAA